MRSPTQLLFPVVLLLCLLPLGLARAGDDASSGDPGPDVVVHVPIDEMHVLLRADRRGVVLKHEEYERLLAEARAQAEVAEAQPPADGSLVFAEGDLDLTGPVGVSLALRCEVRVLADRPSTLPFPLGGLALDQVRVDGEGHYEELDGVGRLRFAGAGTRTVEIRAFASPTEHGDQRLLDLRLPPASAMALTLRLPPSVEGEARGEGPGVPFRTSAEAGKEIALRPDRAGRLKVAWGPASQTVDGPPVLDVETKSFHGIEDGLIRSNILVHVDVLRTPLRALTLAVPPDLALRALGGKGVAGSSRSDDRKRVDVELDAPRRGRITITIDAETPSSARTDVALPSVVVLDAVRQKGEVALSIKDDVQVHGVRVEGGRRLASLKPKGAPPLLHYALAHADGRVLVDLVPSEVRLDASSTYYLNLTEPAKTLLAAVTYRVVRGTAFELEPRFPPGYALLALEVNGRTDGFRFDDRPDGTIQVRLTQGVKEGGEVALVATLEEAAADWVPEEGVKRLPFPIPSAGAAREEAFVGVGADASFRVLDADVKDLVPVGAAELTTRGVSPVGLVYGYRLDGSAPSVRLEVARRTPRLDAAVVAHAEPGPRRLTVRNAVIHTIERAGVRRLLVDVPAWAGDEVRIHAADLVASAKLAEQPADVPAGYVRWEAVLGGRVLGEHLLLVRYHEDQDEDDWSVPAERPLAVRIPIDHVERSVVVARSPGLEVALTGRAGVQDLADLPSKAKVDPLAVREVVRLEPEMNGPGIVVTKHEGAPVLDAIAPTVALDTAVAREGILRTRATLQLVNVGLQFLRVALPAESELVGAIVDAESVKPLVDPGGTLRIPIPPARQQGAPTTVALTYETRYVGDAIEGKLAVPAPEFPGLEVLKTSHTIAFDPGVEIRAVEGDFGLASGARPRPPEPWILGPLFAVGAKMAPAVGSADRLESEAAAPTSVAQGVQLQRGATMEAPSGEDAHPQWESMTEPQEDTRRAQLLQDEMLARLQQEKHRLQEQQADLTKAGDLFRADRTQAEVEVLRENLNRLRQHAERPAPVAPPPQVRMVPVPMRYETVQTPDGPKLLAVAPSSARMEVFPGLREPSDPTGPPPPAPTGPSPVMDPPADLPMEPAPDQAGPPRSGGPAGQPGRPQRPQGAEPDPGGEGPVAQPPRVPTRAKRRKGLLSLDVPVILSPNRVVGERLGSGGTMVVTIVERESVTARRAFLTILFFAVGLALGVRRRRWAWILPVGAGIFLAVLVGVVFGIEGALVVVALVDAVTALAIVLLLRAIVRRITFGRSAGKVAAATILALLLVPAATARADEEQACVEIEEEVTSPHRVYVPYDPSDPAVPRPDDRVFLPFDTYLHLRKAANPDEDPEVIEKGRFTTITAARHTLRIGLEEAEGTLALAFAKRGEGVDLVALPLGGLAVTKAVLDGVPVRLILRDGAHRVPLSRPGAHELEIGYRAPVARSADGRHVVLDVPPFTGAVMDLAIDDFDGTVRVPGSGRVAPVLQVHGQARTRVHLGALARVTVRAEEPAGAEPEVALRTRAETHTVHSIRDGGTESRVRVTLHVLQGEAAHLDLALPEGLTVLRAGGRAVARWDETGGRLRLVFAEPVTAKTTVDVVVARDSEVPARREVLPALAVLDTTGERGVVVVNAHPFLRVETEATQGLLRTATPRDKTSRGADGAGRVAGAWHFSARPTRFAVAVEEAPEGMLLETTALAAFGDDHVRCRFDAALTVDPRVPVGDLVFRLPGTDEVRGVISPGLATWWTEGEGEVRTLHLRYAELRHGTVAIRVLLERRLGGRRDAVTVPWWRLEGAKRDRGVLVLYARPDLEPDPGRLPGLRSIPLTEAPKPKPPLEGALPVRAFRWEEPPGAALPVTLRTPALEVEAVVVSEIRSGDEMHQLDHLVLFDVRRGATERFDVFVPDGGYAALDVVRTPDLREVRRRTVTRRGPDGSEVEGTLYEIRTQSPRGGIVEVTVGQLHLPDRAVRVVRPERVRGEDDTDREVRGVRYFGLVRGFLDGDVTVRTAGGEPSQAEWDDLPFLPSGLEQTDVFKAYSARSPYVLDVVARRHELEKQAGAVVHAARADVVLGRDGQARVRVAYRLFNRRRQFLRVRLPESAVLFGVTVAGRPVKTLQGQGADLLVPVPKVPLGGAGYAVALLYRAPAGRPLPSRDLVVNLPLIEGAEVDRTVIRLFVPDGFDYDIESEMTEAEAEDVAADLAEAAVREAKNLISVAKSGTLEQRALAADNALQIVAEANDLNIRAGNKRKGLDRDVQQVTRDFQDRYQSVEKDLRAARRARVGQELEVYASNAAPFVGLVQDVEQSGPSQSEEGGGGGPAETKAAKWAFNPYREDERAGKKPEFQQLKERLGKALEDRAKQEVADYVADYDVQVAQAASIADSAQTDATWKNFARLNDKLAEAQGRNRQLGVKPTPQQAGELYFGSAASPYGQSFRGLRQSVGPDRVIVNLDDVTNGLDDLARAGYDNRGTGLTTGAALNPSSGVFFDDGADGDFRGRTENLMGGFGFTSFGYQTFADENGDGFFTDQPNLDYATTTGVSGGAGGGYQGGATRTGLMGVDVALPEGGKVYHFRALHAGAPLEIRADPEGWSPGLRWLVFLGVLAAAVAGLVAFRTRTKR